MLPELTITNEQINSLPLLIGILVQPCGNPYRVK